MSDSPALKVVSVGDLLAGLGEAGVGAILRGFECPLNSGVEDYVRNKAISFNIQGLAAAFLVGRPREDPDQPFEIDGFFALASKVLTLDDVTRLPRRLRDRLSRFGTRDESRGSLTLAMPLVAQLGRNFAHEPRVSGHDLVDFACRKVVAAQRILGGRMVYLEAEDNARLLQFYSDNEFVEIGRRKRREAPDLIQMIRYLGPYHRMTKP